VTLRTLGRAGVADLVERSCARARALAEGLARLPGCEVLNEVVLNQVLIRFEDDASTDATLAAVQESGEAWTSGTTRNGRKAIRFSVSNWQTSERDVERTIAAFAAARTRL
jgi:glutamate/tyrosine decarboxylase-like PLP-dependent enzyme